MIDLHNDALLKLKPKQLLPYLHQAKTDGIDEIWLSVWTTELKNPLSTIKAKQSLLKTIAGNANYPICRLHIEDAWFITPENLDELIKIKPHSVGLTWNSANHLAGGANSRTGITAFGYQVIQKLEQAGIQIDTAHLNRRSFWELAKVTTRPLICTHTAFDQVHHHPRNLTKAQIRAIVQSDGMIGICLVPQFLTKNTTSCGFYDILKHIIYYNTYYDPANLCLGSDFYGTEHLPHGIKNYADLVNLFNAKIIGFSVMKQPIIAYQIGNPAAAKRILVTGGMHAREWITTHVVRQLMIKSTVVPCDCCLMFVPNCNPDGTRLAQSGLSPFFHHRRKFLQRINHQSSDFSLWKANARAVDLNVNFNAGWGQGRTNLTTPAPANYIGKRPHSEPETRALLKLIDHFKPTISLAFHSKGEMIYYSRIEDQTIANRLGEITQYRPALSIGSYGGLTDYLALRLGIPAFTIEVGSDQWAHPLTVNYLPEIMSRLTHILDYFFTGA